MNSKSNFLSNAARGAKVTDHGTDVGAFLRETTRWILGDKAYDLAFKNETVKWYTQKFKQKMGGSTPSTAAWWVDGINDMATLEEKQMIWRLIQEDIDHECYDSGEGFMPEWIKE